VTIVRLMPPPNGSSWIHPCFRTYFISYDHFFTFISRSKWGFLG
jgi:hypothetical protein